jgi:hypothetical protein
MPLASLTMPIWMYLVSFSVKKYEPVAAALVMTSMTASKTVEAARSHGRRQGYIIVRS